MFRANRIGSPQIYQDYGTTSAAAWAPQTSNAITGGFLGNVINPAAVGDFANTHLEWTGAAVNVGAGLKLGLGQQFTITQPIKGNTVGIELEGQIKITGVKSVLMQPFITRISAAVSGALTAYATPTYGRYIGAPIKAEANPAAMLAAAWKEHVIINMANLPLAGTYVHGIMFTNLDAGNWSISQLYATASVRQNQDQTGITYTDTRR